MNKKVNISLLNGDTNIIIMKENSGLLLKREITKQMGIEYFTGYDMDTETEYVFNGKLCKNLLLTILEENPMIKTECVKHGIYKYKINQTKTEITNGKYIAVLCMFYNNNFSVYKPSDTNKSVIVNGKTKCFVKTEVGRKKLIILLLVIGLIQKRMDIFI